MTFCPALGYSISETLLRQLPLLSLLSHVSQLLHRINQVKKHKTDRKITSVMKELRLHVYQVRMSSYENSFQVYVNITL